MLIYSISWGLFILLAMLFFGGAFKNDRNK